MRIRTKLQLAFILTSLILAVSIMSVTYFYLEAHFEKDQGNRLKENVDRTGKVIDDFMFSRVTDFKVLSNSPLFNSSSNDKISTYFSSLIANYPFYESLFYVDKKGIILSSTNKKLIGANILELEPDLISEFNNTLKGKFDDVFISDISKVSQKEIDENSPVDLELLSNVTDENQNVIGVLVGAVCLDTLGDLIFKNDKHHFNNQYIYLMGNNGVVLKSNNLNTAILEKLPAFAKLKEKLKTTKNGYYIHDNLSKEKVISGFTKLSKYGTERVGNWTLVSIVPYKEIMKPLYLIIYKTIFILFVILIILIIFFYYYYKKKIQATIEIAEKREFSLNEVSKVAKIGYWDYNLETDTVIWSNQIYSIFGLNPKKGPIKLTDTVKLFDEESQNKIKLATENLIKKGISYDLELKFINAKKEDIWVRSIAQPIINKQNIIVGRRGIIQDITTSKKANLENELSKQKVQTSLELLEKSEHSKNEASKIAKIGFHEYIIETDSFTLSDYVFDILGFNPKEKIPSRLEILSLFDQQSQQKIQLANDNLNANRVPFDVELRLINFKNEELWIRNVVQPLYNESNKIIGRKGVILNITASKKAQLELEKSKQKIEDSLQLLEKSEYSKNEASKVAKIGYWEHDLVNENVIWSDYVHELFGTNPKEGIPNQEKVVNNFEEISREKFTNATINIIAKGVPYDLELKYNNSKLGEIWIRIVAQPIYNDKNEVVGKRGIAQNITRLKTINEELELSRQKTQATLELVKENEYSLKEAGRMAKIGYWSYYYNEEKIIWSDAVHQIFGTNSKEGSPDVEVIIGFFDEESQQKILESVMNLTVNGTPYDIELRINNLKGKKRWIRNIGENLYNDKDEIVGRRGVIQDITESKIAHQQLEQSNQKIQATLDLLEKSESSKNDVSIIAKIGYFEDNIKKETRKWSDALYHIFGFNPQNELPSREEIAALFDLESQQIIAEATMNLDTNGVSIDVELKMTNKKQEEVWLRILAQPVYNHHNKIVGRRGVMQDITQSKLNKIAIDNHNEKLNEFNTALNQAQKLSHVGSWHWDMAKDHAEWTDEMYNIYGVTRENFYPSNENVSKTVLPENLYKLEKGVKSLLVDKMFVPFEFRIMRPSGEIRNLYIVALEKNSEEIVFGVTKDITEQKQIEEKNARITEEYKVLFDNATISIWNEDFTEVFKQLEEFKKRGVKSIKNYLKEHPEILYSLIEKIKVNSVNKATLTLFKAKNAEEFITKIDTTFGEGADKVFRNFMNAIWQNQKTFVSEINYKKLNGEEFAAIVSIPIPQTIIGQKAIPISIQSIQKIKEANKERNESIITLNEAQKLAHIGNWVYNLTTKKLVCSDEMFKIWDFNQIEGVPEFEIWIKRIHKDDKKKYLTILTEAIELGAAFDVENRICLPNQKVKIVRTICQPVIGANGKVVSLRGTNQDVTEHNRIKDEIVKAQELYRVLADNSNDLICLHEIDSTFKYISPSIKTLLGYEQSECIGKFGFDLIYKDDVAFFRKSIEQRVSNKGINSTFYCRTVHKDGHFPWFEFSTSVVFIDGKINYILTSSRDITEWMIAKQEIQDYQSSLQRLTTELTMVEEKQKKEIASNIHDHLSQSLVISKMRINVLKKNPVLSIINEDLKFIETHISDALENSRKITYELSPPALYQLGIIDALSLLLEDVEEKHKIMCSFNTNVDHIKLNELKSILLYRSIQELITNTLKYAAATLITLDIYKNNLGINILITDNGAGFDTTDLNKLNKTGSGLGLFAVQERIRNIQGKFSIKAKKNIGTRVKIFVPLAK